MSSAQSQTSMSQNLQSHGVVASSAHQGTSVAPTTPSAWPTPPWPPATLPPGHMFVPQQLSAANQPLGMPVPLPFSPATNPAVSGPAPIAPSFLPFPPAAGVPLLPGSLPYDLRTLVPQPPLYPFGPPLGMPPLAGVPFLPPLMPMFGGPALPPISPFAAIPPHILPQPPPAAVPPANPAPTSPKLTAQRSDPSPDRAERRENRHRRRHSVASSPSHRENRSPSLSGTHSSRSASRSPSLESASNADASSRAEPPLSLLRYSPVPEEPPQPRPQPPAPRPRTSSAAATPPLFAAGPPGPTTSSRLRPRPSSAHSHSAAVAPVSASLSPHSGQSPSGASSSPVHAPVASSDPSLSEHAWPGFAMASGKEVFIPRSREHSFALPPAGGPVRFSVPPRSAWFRFDAINKIEQRALPEFFFTPPLSKFKTPEMYKNIRDLMISTYRQSPQQHLSFTACRTFISGDVTTIWRIHNFLEYWSLINYNCDPASRPQHQEPFPAAVEIDNEPDETATAIAEDAYGRDDDTQDGDWQADAGDRKSAAHGRSRTRPRSASLPVAHSDGVADASMAAPADGLPLHAHAVAAAPNAHSQGASDAVLAPGVSAPSQTEPNVSLSLPPSTVSSPSPSSAPIH